MTIECRPDVGDECATVLPPKDHAWQLVDWLEEEGVPWQVSSERGYVWTDSHWWLSMAAGLEEVRLDLAPRTASYQFDATEAELAFGTALNETASRYQCEVTRLLYTWAAQGTRRSAPRTASRRRISELSK